MNNNKDKKPLVVIFGRTNVGKSTLFNCLTERRQAMVADIDGTTRDANLGQVEWQGSVFDLVDTGGIMDIDFMLSQKGKASKIESRVQEQAVLYLKKADLILFVVDNKTGLLPQDRQMSLVLKKIGVDTDKVILVANKTDTGKQIPKASEFYKLALGEPMAISSLVGIGTGDLLDLIMNKFKILKLKFKNKVEKINDNLIDNVINDNKTVNVCLMGKPNVGKSSLLNSILGYERVIVSPLAHTTREPQNTEIEYNDYQINLIDTAGISKKGQLSTRQKLVGKDYLIKYGINKSLNTLKRSDIVLFILDINEEITHQDASILKELVDRQKSLIIIANKWDLVQERDTKKFTDYIYDHLPFARWAPIQFVSAKTGEKVGKILDLIIRISEDRKQVIESSKLNTHLMNIIKIHKPAKAKGIKHPYIYELSQLKSNPPVFKVRIGTGENIHFSYIRFMENRLREKFGFTGTPIRLQVEQNKKVHGKQDEKRTKFIRKK